MIIQKILEWIIIVPLMLFIFIFTFDSFVPLYTANTINDVCREYNEILIKEGHLTSQEMLDLRSKLESKGLYNISLNLPTSLEWGDSFVFEVSGSFDQEKRTVDLNKNTVTHAYDYKKSGMALKGGD